MIKKLLNYIFGSSTPEYNGPASGRKMARAPEKTAVIGDGYEDSPWPMLPRFVVQKAVDGGWAFDGNIGPQVILDIGLFRALARSWSNKKDYTEWADAAARLKDEEGQMMAYAHSVYEYYLHYPENLAQEKASGGKSIAVRPPEFWDNLLKP